MDTVAPAQTQMPPEIARAIVVVMRAVGKLTKEGKNINGNYKYSSMDQFLEATNPACAEAGLIIKPVIITSEDCEIDVTDAQGKAKRKRIYRFEFRFRLIHESGAMWTDPDEVRKVAIDYTGAQTFQIAESYALKAYMRALFQIPTGDKDPDADEQHSATMIRAEARAAKARMDTGEQHVAIAFDGDIETVPLPKVSERVLKHLADLGPADGADWWAAQKHGREQLHGLSPRVAVDLKKRVEAFLAAAPASRPAPAVDLPLGDEPPYTGNGAH